MSKPHKILVDIENRAMQINWQDGHASVYDFTYLRRACPCAECQPWKEGIGLPGDVPEKVKQAVGELNAVSDVQAVGAYAIQLHWADGHSFGIYTWDYMRELCPCAEDAAKRTEAV